MEQKHCKPAFERADPDKKKRVLEAGMDQFSTYGFKQANINVIAKEAGISIGLMYKYFETKEDLFMTVLDAAIDSLEATLSDAINGQYHMTERAELLIRTIQKTAREDSRLHKLYNEITNLSEEHQSLFPFQLYDCACGGLSLYVDSSSWSQSIGLLVVVICFGG